MGVRQRAEAASPYLVRSGMEEEQATPAPTEEERRKLRREEDNAALPEQRKRLVKTLLDNIKHDEKHHGPAFKRMKEDMDFVAGKQWEGQTADDSRYVLNICLQHILNRTSALYARDPKAIARRRPRMDFRVWDERPQSIVAAKQTIALYEQQRDAMAATGDVAGAAALEPPKLAMEIMDDFSAGMDTREQRKRYAHTLELLYTHQQGQVEPTFKECMKQLVRRVEATGVGYVEVGFQRLTSKAPDVVAKIEDATAQLRTMERLSAELSDNEAEPDSAEAEELRLVLRELQDEPESVTVSEGLTWDFPASTSVIPDSLTRHLKGFVGARWVTRKHFMTASKVKEVYGVDLSEKNFTRYHSMHMKSSEVWASSQPAPKDDMCCVYVMQHKADGLIYTMVDGYSDFLEEPRAPTVEVEGFWTLQALTFNDIEEEGAIFPPSDVRLLRHPQKEYNRTMEARRQHRIANRPLYAAGNGAFPEEDVRVLANAADHDVLMLGALQAGQKVADLLSEIPRTPIDPNLYETETVFQDFTRASGSQEATFGSLSKGSATEASIAEGSRVSSLQSNADDLDELLSMLARKCSQILLSEFSEETVKEIVGPGAWWPTLTRADIAKELYLEIEAGSTGRPNKAQDIANLERLSPLLLQIPGISPEWLARIAIETLDSRIDLTEAFSEAIKQSITAQNAAPPPGTGDPATDPAQQGGQGGNNARQGATPSGGPQPAFPQQSGRTSGGEVAGRS